MKLIAVVPAKKHSRRLENKNFKFFFGKPIIYWVVEEIYKSELFDKVIVSTDVGENYPRCDAEYYNRPEHLCSDTATVDEVCLDVLEKYTGYDYMCVLYPTAYAVRWNDLCDSFICMSSNPIYRNLYSTGMLNSTKHSYKTDDNAGFYWVKINEFLISKKLIMDGWKYTMKQVDINDIEDFAQAKLHALTLGDRFK